MGDKTTAGRRPIYARWYVIAGVLLLVMLIVAAAISPPLSGLLRSPYRTFYLPGESMRPTLNKGDMLLAQMRRPPELRRGMIVLIAVGEATYIQRIAALPGDRIEFVEGDVILNGRPVSRLRVGREREVDPFFGVPPTRYAETFPGEIGSHEIWDSGVSAFDDVAEQVVRPGHIFVLGDNRDHSADSRVSRDVWGVEQVPVSDIQGFALFAYWRSGKGLAADPLAQ